MNLDLMTILYTIFIQPLQFVFELIFSVTNKITYHPGLSIIVLSLVMNFLVLPLYKRADDMQEQQREKEAKLKKGMDHIKKSFKGDERMMILQTYYRQNNYKPTDALNGSISLLLEIPFFMAAYNFLSHLALLEGTSLGPIANLGQPDAMFMIGGLTINVLPILMTLVNIISSSIYLKGSPLKTKIQLYAMAMFFLVFLYDSPSGLVFYWTLNNVFSLCKNIFYKLKNPGKTLKQLASILGIIIVGFVLFLYDTDSMIRKVFLMGVGLLLQMPLVISKVRFNRLKKINLFNQANYRNVLLSGLVITIFVGLYIPSSVISSSPEEFMSLVYFHNPNNYLVYTTCMAFGFFVVWVGVFYWISNKKFKSFIEKILVFASIMFIVNFMFFGTDLGTLLPDLKYQETSNFATSEILLNLLVIALICIVVILIFKKFNTHLSSLLCIMAIAFAMLSGFNISKINKAANDYQIKSEEILNSGPHFNLSKNGKNVVIIMLDRAMNSHVPYIFNEKPELLEKFDGFTYYSNTVSFGGYTNFCTPSVFGGYEYTPLKLNERDDELLVDKHNEALKVLPVLFDQNDFDVTVFDPSYANYTWVPDVSIYDEYPDIDAYVTEGLFNSEEMEKMIIDNNYRSFFCFSLMKTLPICLQNSLYDYGYYHRLETTDGKTIRFTGQKATSITQAEGIDNTVMKSLYVLQNMSLLTTIQDDESNNFLMMSNSTTHEPVLLQTPEYLPSMIVDNTEYFESVKDKYTIDGVTLKMEDISQVSHYHVNMASFIQLANWFDYLRENDVYDNTKIILVADHGRALYQVDEMIHDEEDAFKNVEFYYPLLMVKDFYATGFTTSDEFMTNADTATIAVEDTITNPVNPFTGNLIDNSAKNSEPIYIIQSYKWGTDINNGYTFIPARWATVQDDVMEESNWTYFEGESINPRQ